jgi:hypothetical protein
MIVILYSCILHRARMLPKQQSTCHTTGDHFNLIEDHLSHNREQAAITCAASALGVLLALLPSSQAP